MASGKFVGWFVLVALVVAAIGGGAPYVILTLRDRDIQSDISLARGLHEKGDEARALKIINGRLDRARGSEAWVAEILALKLEVLLPLGRRDEARRTAQLLVDPARRADGRPALDAHAFLGADALEAGDADRAREHFEVILKQDDPMGYRCDVARLGMARIRIARHGATDAVLQDLVDLHEQFSDSEVREEVEFVLGQCNLKRLYALAPGPDDQLYTIEPGDTIDALARKSHVSRELLLKINNISDPRRLAVSRRIKIPNLDFSIQVDKAQNTLTIFNHGEFFKKYDVRTGKEEFMTPIGEFKVQTKKINPTWTNPRTGEFFPANHPDNELGTRWIGFQGGGLGIHGTIHPETIGLYASFGCVGMLPDDVEELFDLLRIGTPLQIVGSIQTLAAHADDGFLP